jgi:hypothetical protein
MREAYVPVLSILVGVAISHEEMASAHSFNQALRLQSFRNRDLRQALFPKLESDPSNAVVLPAASLAPCNCSALMN